jgi:hypothetical protein
MTTTNIHSVTEKVNSNTRHFIIDEEGKYVSDTACKKVSKTEYTYVNYELPNVSYPSQATAKLALLKLEKACYFAKMPYHFTIKSEEVLEPRGFVIKDQDNKFVDSSSIFILDNEWNYWAYTTEHTSGLLRYYSKERAERIMEGLNQLKQFAGFSGIEFHVEELISENLDPAEDVIVKIPMAKGTKTKSLKFRNQVLRQYMC